MKTNTHKLVMLSVQGQVSPPQKKEHYIIQHDGQPVVFPGTGGITYNVKIGDPVAGWMGDHIEPGVSVKVVGENKAAENAGLNILSCLGNQARIISGDAKDEEGTVTGKHGGIEHLLLHFRQEVLEKLSLEDKVLIKSWGQGLQIEEAPQVKILNLDPRLLEKMPLNLRGDTLEVPVVATIPPELMGSGLGAPGCYSGDYDLTTADWEVVESWGLDKLRFGDVVAIQDSDHSYGRCFKKNAVSVGVVVHSNCVRAGHGPGITTIFTSSYGKIRPEKSDQANIGDYLGISG